MPEGQIQGEGSPRQEQDGPGAPYAAGLPLSQQEQQGEGEDHPPEADRCRS